MACGCKNKQNNNNQQQQESPLDSTINEDANVVEPQEFKRIVPNNSQAKKGVIGERTEKRIIR